MFGAPVSMKVLTLVLRKARPWTFFGLNSIELIVEPGPMLLVSGVTAREGFQCVVDGGEEGAALRSCAGAAAEGAGDEIFMSTPEGVLRTTANPDRCLVVSESSAALATGACSKLGAPNPEAIFELNGASQLLLPRKGKCVAVQGVASDATALAGASAKASGSQPGHPVANVLDEDPRTYWAAEFMSEPVDVTISLGAVPVKVESVSIDFEYPAKSFQVDVSSHGPWRTVFATSANNLNATHIAVGHASSLSVRVRLFEPHPVWAVVGGRSIVGIRSITVGASSAALVAKDCAEASVSGDAGDKFFMVAVPEFDAAPAEAAKDFAELARAAGNRLAGLLADLEAKGPTLASCGLVEQRACATANCTLEPAALARKTDSAHTSASRQQRYKSTLDAVIASARRTIASFSGKVR